MKYVLPYLVLLSCFVVVNSELPYYRPWAIDTIFKRNLNEVCIAKTAHVPIRLIGCEVRRVPLKQCTGVCMGTDHPAAKISKCTCCTPLTTSDVMVDVICQRGSEFGVVQHKLKQHETCSCLPC